MAEKIREGWNRKKDSRGSIGRSHGFTLVERMMVPNLDADAAQQVIDDETGGKKLCPNGGSYLVEKSSDSMVVSCGYHGKTPPQVVGDKIETAN